MLRQLRMDAGRSRKEASAWLEVGEPTISKIELGRQAIKGPNVRVLCQLYDVDASKTDYLLRLASEANQRGWWTAYRDTVPDWFRQFVGLESDATDIWNYEAEFVPGLLQTSHYAEAITKASRPEITAEELERAVRLRAERQDQLDGNAPPRLHFYLNEAVIRRVVGSTDIMREQLKHMRAQAELDNVSLRIVPFTAGAHAAMASPFVMMQFPDEPEPAFVYIENDRGAIYQEDPGDIDRYSLMVDQLNECTLSTDDSAKMLDEAIRSQ